MATNYNLGCTLLEFFMFSQDDDDTRFALGLVAGAVILAIAVAAGATMYHKHKLTKAMSPAVAEAAAPAASTMAEAPAAAAEPVAAAAEAPAATAAAEPAADVASIAVEGGVVKFYFASGQSALAEGGPQALSDIAAGIQAGKKAIVSGYVDSTGSAAQNKEIAKKRAFAVRDLLLSLGVPAEKIELQKPADIQAGAGAQARRVEVTLQ
jgi:outer membrane protein OmpA-like peptidoglycan-associated protein